MLTLVTNILTFTNPTCESIQNYYQNAPLVNGIGCCNGSGVIQTESVNTWSTSAEIYETNTKYFFEDFQTQHPFINLNAQNLEQELFKNHATTLLSTTIPQINVWIETMFKQRRETYPYTDLTPLWNKLNLDNVFTSSSKNAVTHDNKIAAIPFDTYIWHMYYNTDVLKRHGLVAPTTWGEFKTMCTTLSEANKNNPDWVSPITMYNTYWWVGLGWIDIMFSRFAGPQKYESLRNGLSNWTDPSFDSIWTELDFVRTHMPSNNDKHPFWQSHIDLQQNKTAAYFMGGFAESFIKLYFPFSREFKDFPVDNSSTQLVVSDVLMAQGPITPGVEAYLDAVTKSPIISSNINPSKISGQILNTHGTFQKNILDVASAQVSFMDRIVPAKIIEVAQIDIQDYFMKRIDSSTLRAKLDVHFST